MSIVSLPTRVERVEISMEELKRMVAETTENVNQLSRDMQEFKAEMRERNERSEREIKALDERTERNIREARERSERNIREARERSEQEIKALDERTERNIQEFKAEMREARERSEQTIQALDERTERNIREARERSEQTIQALDERSERNIREARERSEQTIQEAREHSEQEQKNLRRELASITHSIGRLVEDLVGPSMPGIVEQVVPCDEPAEMIGVRSVRKRADGYTQEYDVLALCGPYLMITEVKTRLRTGDIEHFLHTLEQARSFMPEHADKQIIGALATFYVDETQARQAEQHGLVVLGVVDGLMRVLNQPEFTPRSF